jgi:hypothetical protein
VLYIHIFVETMMSCVAKPLTPALPFFLPCSYGELPTEFTKEICPGLEFDANGLPKMSPDGSPFGGNEDCRIM